MGIYPSPLSYTLDVVVLFFFSCDPACLNLFAVVRV